ncbi:MAG: SLC13 family permease, partial [Bacillota bacterium]|nr:SLC13 family permease [Bacillota bacterium]
FLLTYVLLLSFPKSRAYVATGAAVLFILLSFHDIRLLLNIHVVFMPLDGVFAAIEWNVILMIFGTMGLVSLFIESRMPALMADKIIQKTPNVKWAVIALAAFAGLISAFVDNVATVLMVAPIALTIAKRLKISPVSMIIAIAVASNLEGAATLVGDTTSILLGGYANLTFSDFFFYLGKPSMFWINQVGLFVAVLVLLRIFRKDDQPVSISETTVVTDFVPSILMLAMIGLLITASFIPSAPALINGIICTGLMIFGVIRKTIVKKDKAAFVETMKDVDFFTLLLLASLFIVVKSIENAGVIAAISEVILDLAGGNVFVIFTLILWGSVLLSAFIDNIPYVATMLPVVTIIAGNIAVGSGLDLAGEKQLVTLLYFGLLAGATLGGNMTPIGASANITAIGILRKEGYDVNSGEFMRIGVPFTL